MTLVQTLGRRRELRQLFESPTGILPSVVTHHTRHLRHVCGIQWLETLKRQKEGEKKFVAAAGQFVALFVVSESCEVA